MRPNQFYHKHKGWNVLISTVEIKPVQFGQ